MIEKKLVSLRKTVRNNQKQVTSQLIKNHNSKICIICGTQNHLSKEHVVPRWAFEKDPNRRFVTEENGISQEYNKTTVPACKNCNSNILGSLERYLEIKFTQIDLNNDIFNDNDIEKIILWLELIDYKFHVLNLRRKFIKSKNGNRIKYLENIPLTIIQNIEISSSKVFSKLRKTLKKLSVKSKANKINSLVIFKTKNTNFYFFHKMDEFIYIELPKYEIALFYFLNEEYENNKDAYSEAMKIIKNVYS
ncbi:hypothetical protein [uncultured Aquimarina sp.]|uniref:hypothetical protein n=1 Tax=uncultured Aquimarina sp. TaxID=575652 RepID=UPI00261ACD2A|nr:hypothetical protein [uncultured Aquimarina sp.]